MRELTGLFIICGLLVSLEVCNAASIPDTVTVPRAKRDTFTSRIISRLCAAFCEDNGNCTVSFEGKTLDFFQQMFELTF